MTIGKIIKVNNSTLLVSLTKQLKDLGITTENYSNFVVIMQTKKPDTITLKVIRVQK